MKKYKNKLIHKRPPDDDESKSDDPKKPNGFMRMMIDGQSEGTNLKKEIIW